MGTKIPLGAAAPASVAVMGTPQTLEEKVEALALQVAELMKAFNVINSTRMKDKRQQQIYDEFPMMDANKDGIPIGVSLVGSSERGGIKVLTINPDGYYIGNKKFDSLSAAAEAASGVRRSGWTFWKLPDGRTVKEAFGKR